MRNVVRWAIDNTPAMNVVMVVALIVGTAGLAMMRREVFPEFELEIVLVRVPYPGASPDETEEGICQKIEESVRAIDGIKKITSVAGEGLGTVILELDPTTDVEKCLNEVRSEVDRISTFPELAEDPDVEQLTFRTTAIKVAILGPPDESTAAELRLREVAEEVRSEVIRLKNVSQAKIKGAKNYQIDIEIPEETLREYGLTLRDVAATVRRENLELPGGTIKTASQDVIVKGDNKGVVGDRIEQLPLVTTESGAVLTVGDLGRVKDEFADTTAITKINGRPAMVVAVERTADEDILNITEEVEAYVASKSLPPGYGFETYSDRSIDVRDRMNLLKTNGLQGLFLVLFVLALFLNSRLAFWVAMGIPVSVLGAGAVLYMSGQTLNMLTMFAFLMALGIVVDDAIVIGENIYSHRQMGKRPLRAAIDGTVEVAPSVAASVSTTVIAFMPLFFVSGVMGKFIACMPLAMIAMLVISLVESIFILPCHLAHDAESEDQPGLIRRQWNVVSGWNPIPRWTIGVLWVAIVALFVFFAAPFSALGRLFDGISSRMNRGLDWFAENVYLPFLRFGINNVALSTAGGVAMLMLAFAVVKGGHVKWEGFPKLDSRTLVTNVTFPDGTPSPVTDAATQRVEAALAAVDARLTEQYGKSFIRLVERNVGHGERAEGGGPGNAAEVSGGHIGSVSAQLVGPEERPISSAAIVRQWREEYEKMPAAGVETITFGSEGMGPGGKAIEFKLLADAEHFDELREVVSMAKERLAQYPGVFDVADDDSPGKYEYRLAIEDDAIAMGVPLAELAQTVRSSYYGEEVMRLQRGRHEVKLMVRYPAEDRRSRAEFDDIRVRTADGSERPLVELASIDVVRGPSEVNRVDQLRSITITADVDTAEGNASEIVTAFRNDVTPEILADYPEIGERWEGQAEQTRESFESLLVGYLIAMFAMFVLLVLEFRSYLQPLIVMAIIPFGFVGAVTGHWWMGLPLTLFSVFGLVALTGVVVNDSIVLIDFINHRMRDGLSTDEALLDAGRRRLRPVILTSVTTIAGLLPLLVERSFQAQILIPMAVSLAFGLMIATVIVLFLVPVFYRVYAGLTGGGAHAVDDEEGRDSEPLLSPAEDASLPQSPAPPRPRPLPQPLATQSIVSEGST